MKRQFFSTSTWLLTVAMTVFAATLNFFLGRQDEAWPLFLALWPAAFLSAYLGGWRHAALSLTLGLVFSALLHPHIQNKPESQALLMLGAFAVCAVIFVWFCWSLKLREDDKDETVEPFPLVPWQVMAGAISAALVVVAANFYVYPALGKNLPFALFYPVMAAAGFFGGARPVVAVMVIGLVSVSLWQSDLAGTANDTAFNVLRGMFAFIGLTYAVFSDAVVRQRALVKAGASALRELPEAQARFSAIAQTSPDALWIADFNSKTVLYMSRAFIKLTGLSVEEGLRQSREDWIKAIHPEDLEIVRKAMSVLAHEVQDQTVEYEYRHLHLDGKWRVLRNRAGVFARYADGTVSQIFGHSEDFTERREAEELLARQTAELARVAAEREETILEREKLLQAEREARSTAEKANRLKDDFLATVSHELRTPLTAMLGWTSLLAESTRDNEVLQGLEVINRNARSQRQLVEDLLDMSRIMTGNLRLDIEPVDLKSVVAAAVQTVTPAAQSKGVELITEVKSCDEFILADAERLQQIVWNLVSNAVKFTDADGRVAISIQCSKETATIKVADTGQGIAAEFLPHVFERFRQEDSSTTRKASGLGLGLSIVRHLVELHGGSVKAESEGLGKGCVFTVSLPLRKRVIDPSVGERASGATVQRPLVGRRVLIIDDEADTRTFLQRVLSERGAEVLAAASAVEGLGIVQEKRPEAILCDISMPGEDGYQFIEKIRKDVSPDVSRIPAGALTAFARENDRQLALAAGFDLHCAKPVEPADLLTLVQALLEKNKVEASDS